MIVGIGTDMIEINRVIKACEKELFQKKYFTPKEIELAASCKNKFADNFAVKEAVSKMFGTGFHNIKPIEIEVLRDSLGKPYVNLYGSALEISNALSIAKIFVSITNTNKYACAFVVGES
ncbi:holo-[acyl-carrier-protein] synthase [Anaerocolumna sedimenticola]|uniref:Holo-[acyl-carrier-protein] synthase n=1 Tax=Anaerocolumna sedimenticola TaxID=2696063 RepID=A0A6P1TQB6_9FIRM|nr:holo-ACP synthase [Anaerocolumna sedimenticola]QHQ62537.1 holo-[acyl-carrier-protein] synthase [Anaerocolumna sedimenticola]